MRPDRKAAREKALAIKTRAELAEYLDSLNLTEQQRIVAWYIFADGWSRAKIALETGYSERQLKRIIAKIYDRMA